MPEQITFSELAVLYELNKRTSAQRLAAFPQELKYLVMLAMSIIGAENAKRVKETPDAVVQDSEGFVSKLLSLADAKADERFKEALELCLEESLRDELRFNCTNCLSFNQCIDMENLTVGELFMKRVNGDESEKLRSRISEAVENALKNTPFVDCDDAHKRCSRFEHNYSSSSVANVFGRYADMAAALSQEYGIDYTKIQGIILQLNMDFFEKSRSREN
ncbi:MAG: hypothetical protein RBT37_00085 [Dissulfurispiraceae bacterium]|jgi:DNA-binding SARP family transcriptional activator|nr:hypothetical protein [Dissulfurispiraceae bacterium]